jgi:hypothetical protein
MFVKGYTEDREDGDINCCTLSEMFLSKGRLNSRKHNITIKQLKESITSRGK